MEDEEYKKLPAEEKCVHKLCKARVCGFEEVTQLFRQIDDEKSPEFGKYLGLVKKFVTDSNAMGQEKGLEATLAYVENYAHAGKTVSEVMSGIVTKCVAAPGTKTRELALQITLMYIEIEEYEAVQEELMKGTEQKNPKIVSACIQALTTALHEFGVEIINPKPIIKKIGAWFSDSDKGVRDEARLLVIEMYKWMGPSLKNHLQAANLESVQMTELEAEFAKVEGQKAVPTRYIRSQQQKQAKLAASAEETNEGEDEGDEDEAPQEIDPYDLADPVDILSKLPKDFYEKLEAKQWRERRKPLKSLETLLKHSKLENGDYGDMVRALRKVVLKDSCVVCVALAGRCIAGLASRLKKRFQTYSRILVLPLLEKFEEKKENVVTAIREAIDATYLTTSLEAILGDVWESLTNKNPSVKSETSLFLARAFVKTQPTSINNKLLKAITAPLTKNMQESDPVVRESSSEALGTLMKLVGEEAIGPFLVELEKDNLKMSKIKEFCEKAEITVKVVDNTVRKLAPEGEDEGDEDEAPQEIDPYDLADPVDILSKLPKDFYEKLEAKQWRERRKPLKSLETLLKHSKLENGDYGDMVRALRKVVHKDSCVVCVALAGRCIAGLASRLKKRFQTYSRILVLPLLEKFEEKKENVVTAIREAIDATYLTTSLEAILDDVLESLTNEHPSVKSETSLFLARAFVKTQPTSVNNKLLKAITAPLTKNMQESDPLVRESSAKAFGTLMKLVGEEAIGPFLVELEKDNLKMSIIKEFCEKAEITVKVVEVKKPRPQTAPSNVAAAHKQDSGDTVPAPPVNTVRKLAPGYEFMAKQTEKIKPSSKTAIIAALEKVRPNLPVKPVPEKATPVEEKSVRGTKPVANKQNTVKPKAPSAPAKAAPPTSGRKKDDDVDTSPLLVVNNLKHQRTIDESKLKVLKWNFTQPREEFVDLLKDQMTAANVNKMLMFRSDFRFHIKAIESLTEGLPPERSETLVSNLDLILKWLSLRFFDTNPSVLLKGLEYLNSVFNMPIEKQYHMLENEGFIPYLVLKIGDPKDSVRNGVRSLLKQISGVFSVSPLSVYVMKGVKSKNARQRAKFREVMSSMIDDYSITVCQPTPAACLKEVAKQISDRDNSVRNAALNCVLQAYDIVGEKVYKMVGNETTATGAKRKSKQAKSPIKLSLSRKTVSPTKRLKPQNEPIIKRPTVRIESPMKYYSPPQNLQKPQIIQNVSTENNCFPKEKQSYIYQKSLTEEKSNFFNELPSNENKSPAYQQLLCNSNSSFTSPSNATSLLEMRNKERRETYTLHVAKGNFIENENCFIDAADTFTIENVENSSYFSDSLEPSSKTLVLKDKNNQGDTRLLNRATVIKSKGTPNFEYKLKTLENFTFSPTLSPYSNTTPRQFLPAVCSKNSKPPSMNNSNESNVLRTELFPQTNQSFQANESNETYTKINLSSSTYTKGNSSFETCIVGNMSARTCVKDSSIGDGENLEKSPISSLQREHSSPLTYRQKSSEFFPNLEVNKSDFEAKKGHLSSIAEESYVFSESALKIGSKRKKSELGIHPSKREKISPKLNKNWSKKGGAPFRMTKSTSGLKLDKCVSPVPKNNAAQPLLTFTETNVKYVRDPFLYANIIDPFMTSQIYCDEEWITQQEIHFKKWLNALLTSPTELNAKTDVDVALIWQECKKKEISDAPTKEAMPFNFHTSSKLDYLRKQAQNLFRSMETGDVLQKVCLVVETGKLSIREDKDLHLNLKLRSDIVSLIMSYNPLWLRVGLETIYNEIIPLKSNSDTQGLTRFILERLLKEPHLLKKHKTLYSAKYSSDLKKFMLKKLLILVYFLDKAKNAKLIQHDPCLFCKNAIEKETKLVLTHFARETLSEVGDITKYLKCLGYVVTHAQSYIHEFDYAVKNLRTDLRDGVRLARIMEIIQIRNDLTSKLRVPAIVRHQKIHNMQLVFKSLQESGYEIQYDICAKDIVDGPKEKTLSFLWQIIYKFKAPLMVKSATIIRTWFRSFPIMLKRCKLRKIYEERENAAKKIQRWYKRQKLSKYYFMFAGLLQNFMQERKQELAAIKIQSFFKMVICRKKYLIQFSVIIKLEAYARGWLIRHNYRRRIVAAKIIQKLLRGYMYRRRFVQLRNVAIIIQRKFRAKQEMRKHKLAYEDLKLTTINIQRRYRASLATKKCRQEFIVFKAAVIKIQSFYRIYTRKKEFLQLVTYTKIIQTKYKAQVAMKKERCYYLSLKKAALIIQRRFRAHLHMSETRKKYLVQKEAVVKIQSFYKMYIIRKYFLQLRAAVKVVQTRYRANSIMKMQRINYLAILNATLLVQQEFRSYLIMKKCRKEFLKLKSATIKVQSSYRRYRCRKRFLDIQNAAKILQERYRAFRAMREESLKYQALKTSVLFVQRKFRANQLKNTAFVRYTQVRQSIITIQNFYRMFVARKRFVRLKRTTVQIQRIYRAVRVMKEQRTAYRKLRNAAVVLQRRWRGRKLYLQQQQSYLKLKKAAAVIQQRFKANKQMLINRRQYYEIRSASIKIQKWYRSILSMKVCREEYVSIKISVLIIEERYLALKSMHLQRSRYTKLKEVTVFIQQHYRAKIQMKIQRKKYLKVKSAAVTIQQWHRAKKLHLHYKKLKDVTVFVQAKFRANRAMRSQRCNYVFKKAAVVRIQQWYRATVKMSICRRYYESLKLAVKKTEDRYKAKIDMEKEKSSYGNLKKSCLIIQRRYRAILMMREIRKQYREFRKGATLIQRRYRAWRAAKIERQKYQTLKNAVICIQRRYRALRSMHQARAEWMALKKSTLYIQRHYRALKHMVKTRNNYKRLKHATEVIQRWYRAQHLMTKHMYEYQNFRRVVTFVQQKFRANVLAKQERARYLRLRKSVLIVQQRFRAQILMKSTKAKYIQLKEVTVMAQRKFRATLLMRRTRDEFVITRRLTILIQRRYRATRAMVKQSLYYKTLKKSVILMQRKFRANKLTGIYRSGFLQLKNAAIVIQNRYRAKMLMVSQVEKYSRIRGATLVIQRRYKAQAVMKREMLRYQQLRHASLIIQRKLRATILCKTTWQRFLKLKRYVRIIQAHYRANQLMKKERGVFLVKYKAVVTIQRFSRGFLVRKKYSSLLTPEAIEARRLLQAQTTAAVKIQEEKMSSPKKNATTRIMGKTTTTNKPLQPLRRAALGDLGNRIHNLQNANQTTKGTIMGLPVSIARKKMDVIKKKTELSGMSKENVLRKENNTNVTKSKVNGKQPVRQGGILCQKKISDALKNQITEQTKGLTIYDPDENTRDDPQMVTEYVEDISSYLRRLENEFPIKEKFLENNKVTPKMRATLVNWLVEAHTNFHLALETLFLSISITDRYLQANTTVDRSTFQLVGTAALLLAAKYEEIRIPDISYFVLISDKAFTKKQLLQMEINIWKTLDFRMGWPVSIYFLRRYSKVAQVRNDQQHTLAKYILELALLEYNLAHIKPSIQAAAACCLSIAVLDEVMDPAKVWTPTLVHYSTYKYYDFKPVLYEFAHMIVKTSSSKLDSVREKYASSKFGKISLNLKLQGPVIIKLTSQLLSRK